MTSIIEIPQEDLNPYEIGRIEMTANNGVRLRFSRTSTHPFHVGVAVYSEKQPKGTPMPMYYLPLDTLRDLGVYLTSLGVQLTREWHALTSDEQATYAALPVPQPNPNLVLVNRDDLRFMLDELEEARETQIEMMNDPYAVRAMMGLGLEEADIEDEINRMEQILDTYAKER